MVRRATNTKVTLNKAEKTKKKGGDSAIILALLAYALLGIGIIFGYGVFYLFCFAIGSEHIKVSLLSLPGLLIAQWFGNDIGTPFLIAAVSIIGAFCIFKFGDNLYK